MKYLTKDSRGNVSRTLPIVWLATIGILIIAYTNGWTGTELAIALAVPAALWGMREFSEKVRRKRAD